MAQSETTDTLQKASFDHVYNQPDPRAYYRQLGSLDYEIPEHGRRLFRPIIDALDAASPTVVDLCCSYGVNAALLRCDLTLDDLYARYCSERVEGLTRDELLRRDRDFFSRHQRPDAPEVVGLDVADRAVTYALEAGLLDAGSAENVEEAPLTEETSQIIDGADIVTATGGVGYITERTVGEVVDVATDQTPPWVAILCLRAVDYDPVVDALADRGLVTEQLEGHSFRQRTFADAEERSFARTELAELGRDLIEDDGYHANLYVSRPADEVRRRPLETLLEGVLATAG